MKLSRKIIPALAMLVMSAIMLTTASFAWFATNADVNANDMSVNIKADSMYLLIASSTTEMSATQVQQLNTTATAGQTASKLDLKPTAHNADLNGSTIGTFSNWYTKVADNKTASTSTSEATSLTTFENYVAIYKFYVTLASGSPKAKDLVLTEYSITASADSAASGTNQTVDPARVIIACGENMHEYKGSEATKTGLTAKLADSVTDTTVVEITVYLYFDGEDTTVYSDNIINLDDFDFTFKLSASADTAQN